jgi:hypothetical protein
LSKRSSTERLAPASKDIFENAFNVSGGWDKAECDGHEIYNWAISEPAIFPVFSTVNVTVTSMSFSFMLGSETSRPEYWKVVYDKP